MSVEARAKEDYKALSQGKGIMTYFSTAHTVSGVGGSCEIGQMTKRRIYLGEAGHYVALIDGLPKGYHLGLGVRLLFIVMIKC